MGRQQSKSQALKLKHRSRVRHTKGWVKRLKADLERERERQLRKKEGWSSTR